MISVVKSTLKLHLSKSKDIVVKYCSVVSESIWYCLTARRSWVYIPARPGLCSICGICMFSLCLHGFPLGCSGPPGTSKHLHRVNYLVSAIDQGNGFDLGLVPSTLYVGGPLLLWDGRKCRDPVSLCCTMLSDKIKIFFFKSKSKLYICLHVLYVYNVDYM